jgi:hypothetical protein
MTVILRDQWLRRRVDEAFADPRPNVPARAVFARLRACQVKLREIEQA